jgi:hypothetical protein
MRRTPIPTLSLLRQGYGGQALPLKGREREMEVNSQLN